MHGKQGSSALQPAKLEKAVGTLEMYFLATVRRWPLHWQEVIWHHC